MSSSDSDIKDLGEYDPTLIAARFKLELRPVLQQRMEAEILGILGARKELPARLAAWVGYVGFCSLPH